MKILQCRLREAATLRHKGQVHIVTYSWNLRLKPKLILTFYLDSDKEMIENFTLFMEDIALVAPFIALPTAIFACIACDNPNKQRCN